MTFQHGIIFSDGGVRGAQIRLGGSAIPVHVGTAYGPTIGTAPLTAKKINNFTEYVETFGWGNRDGDGLADTSAVDHDYTLDEVAWLFFKVYKTGPVVFLNVFDGSVHTSGEPAGPDVDAVAAADIVSAMDLIEPGMSDLGFIPSDINAPRWSQEATVKAAMVLLNEIGPFRPMIHLDLADDSDDDDETAKDAALVEVALYDDLGVFPCWPEVGGFALSGIASAAQHKNVVDRCAGIPMSTPSNKAILVDRADGDRTVLHAWLDTLNEASVCTVRRVGAKAQLWGTWLGSYEGDGGTADFLNDTYMPYRLQAYVFERICTEFFENVDDPTNLRLIEDVVSKLNTFGAQLQGKGAVLGFQVSFLEEDNSIAELAAKRITLRINWLPVGEASVINFRMVLDLTMFSALFA